MTDKHYTMHTRCYSLVVYHLLTEIARDLSYNDRHYFVYKAEDGEIIVLYSYIQPKYYSNQDNGYDEKEMDISEDLEGQMFARYVKVNVLKNWLMYKKIDEDTKSTLEELIGQPLNPFEIEANRINKEENEHLKFSAV